MQNLFVGLCALACPVGMGLMMWMGRRSRQDAPAPVKPQAPADEVQDLRAQRARVAE
jgi:uncharacterized iron-regulated membrane protein